MGLEALATISAMCGSAFVWGGFTVAAAKALLVSASSGIGLIMALGVAMGVALLATATVYQSGLAICAANNMVASYKKTKNFFKSGFKACSYSAWVFTIYTQVDTL